MLARQVPPLNGSLGSVRPTYPQFAPPECEEPKIIHFQHVARQVRGSPSAPVIAGPIPSSRLRSRESGKFADLDARQNAKLPSPLGWQKQEKLA
jgi:hypothetical protein